MRWMGILLACAVVAQADARASSATVIQAMREYYALLPVPGNGNIESIRDRLIEHTPHVSAKMAKSVRRQIDKGFAKKYKKDAAFHKALAETLAGLGKPGLNTLYKRYKATKAPATRIAIAEAMGACGDEIARGSLVKMMHDKDAGVAAAAVLATVQLIPKDVKAKRGVMRSLIDLYAKTTAKAQGKGKETKERKAYETLKPALDKALNAYSEGEELDTAQAWDAWLREQK
ncbi:MAG: HEAT repeat domain-containing protein [Planctomycetota bacterium]